MTAPDDLFTEPDADELLAEMRKPIVVPTKEEEQARFDAVLTALAEHERWLAALDVDALLTAKASPREEVTSGAS